MSSLFLLLRRLLISNDLLVTYKSIRVVVPSCLYSMKIKNKLGNADTDRTKVHQIMSRRSAFDFEEY